MKTYSVKEASEIVGISTRAIQKRCKKENIRKKNNRYLITSEHLDNWRTANEPKNEPTNQSSRTSSQLDPLSVQSFRVQIKELEADKEKLEEQLKFEKDLVYEVKAITDQTCDILNSEVESLKERIEELESELSQYDISDNERLEVFTHDQYQQFEKALIEWKEQGTKLLHQEQLFETKLKSAEELQEHYKNQFDYQRKQSDKILEMHQQLLNTIKLQAKNTAERNLIEAVDKKIVDKETGEIIQEPDSTE